MSFADLLSKLMEFLHTNLILPINVLLYNHGYDIATLEMVEINFGLGQITWFSATLYDILLIVIGLMVSITALVLTWKFVKMLSNIIRRLFGGVRK